MKILGKAIANKVATVIVLALVVVGGIYWFKSHFFGGKLTAEYSFVIKKFSQKSQLIVADAEVETTANKKFSSNLTKNLPEWSQKFAEILVSRKAELKIPVKTEFKLQLEGLNKDDISISNNVLTFKEPILVHVDSQKEGESKIVSSSSGIVDKAVDVVTGSAEAMKFLEEKSQDAIFATTEEVMNNQERQEKVAKYAEEALENLLNLNSDQDLDVQIDKDDLIFKNIDPQK